MLCISKKHLITATQAIIEQAGEGTIIQKPRALYEHGRTVSALKFKVFVLLNKNNCFNQLSGF
jgi:hypothetical protein